MWFSLCGEQSPICVEEAADSLPITDRRFGYRRPDDWWTSMLTTGAAILSAIGLLMPGFIVAELSVARSARRSRSDLELALR